MRTAQLLALSGLMLMSNVAMGAELDHDDVPNRCWDVCGPVVGIAHKCDNMHDSDRAEMNCICDWKQAPSLIPLCEACIAQYRSERNNRDHDDDDDDDDRNPHHNDAYDILTSCSLSTTSYNPTAAASAVSSASANATDATPTATSSGISDSTNGGSSGNSNSNSASNTNSAVSAQNTGNAASAYSSPKAASLAAVVGLGFLAWL
ncbi:hypothetical protein F9C07_1882 [Aspergillus flavus]|uniref:Uncharacterized protein n=5 Tax=Aspergillus subgen. Circumdati TaxID=2720871 RepID=B8N2Y2_ASPFN|nr:unnamed protein product [Aspergillus oryzae RIB40]XP_041143665.1 uncharacterized protein G4B84_003951 [Aspergillus flavus NRRL3357]EIT83535.1 GPI anchored protein [Aspergillus oryzae 3.042]KAB8246271.1 hypothetical protein BDV35DRAFT_229951 [Aspergillus flavus]KDE78075.1 GPI anchored protein [Aspergillus oryzae 100-8]KOC08958.1 GPI anchored protein [Aspergillus flavus AF70]OOO09741.1 hypothetical protein OAory_01055490 [Aspergillus oryzae]|eukprot:EIT83535.1 GPI anchored protein [Aspergillus oryzae 3.042]